MEQFIKYGLATKLRALTLLEDRDERIEEAEKIISIIYEVC